MRATPRRRHLIVLVHWVLLIALFSIVVRTELRDHPNAERVRVAHLRGGSWRFSS